MRRFVLLLAFGISCAPRPPEAPPKPEVFEWVEPDCGANGVSGRIEIASTGRVTFTFSGWSFGLEGVAVAKPSARAGWTSLVIEKAEGMAPPAPGSTLFEYRLRGDGKLDVDKPPGNCTATLGKGGVFWSSVKPATEVKTSAVHECANGKALALRSGCVCEGTSTIENPCSISREPPKTSGGRCIFECITLE